MPAFVVFFRIPIHFPPSHFWHHLFSSLSLFVVITVVMRRTYSPSSIRIHIYMYTFRINSSVVSVITSPRIMFYNPTKHAHMCVTLSSSLSLRVMLFDLQGCKSQCAWLTKKKNVKDKICLFTYDLYKQQVTKGKLRHVLVLTKGKKNERERKTCHTDILTSMKRTYPSVCTW